MSAAPRKPFDTGYIGLRMTADEYLALGETPERLELVDGVVVMSPSPTPRHQLVVRLVLRQLERYADTAPDLSLFPETDVCFDAQHVYRPDIVCYARGQLAKTPDRLRTPPDLIIEVLSPGTKAFDLTTKKDDYERFGVNEYWAIEPDGSRARCYRRQGSLFVEIPITGDTVESIALPGFVLDLKPIRARA